ncbi:hypothetical protein CVT26_008090 [Gymnopilus dilepis]|uniref:Uncharacterized protein n=1 Tax=Gymnopilus dilepis TaxID=231916 RepID=A0A409WWD7_9AGAR|nr:hypothetical protein CVT26_008090 [Gymnopilus dilepis]
MSANGNATTPVGVLDADGYAICPDCLTRINCGSVGLPNLELRHRGKKVCQSNREKRDKAAKKTKNQSILSFAIRPKAQPVPSTVITAPVVQGEKLAPVVLSSITLPLPSKESSSDLTTTGHNLDNSDFLVRFFDTIRRLPSDVPEGKEYDILAIFAGNPAQHDDPSLTADDLWETSLNSLLKSTLGWGTEGDMDNVIRRGRMGLDGLANFVKYFVVKRGVSKGLFEGKLTYLMERIEEKILTSEKMAASGPAISDVAVQEIPAVVLVGEPAAMPPLAQEDDLDNEVIDVESFDYAVFARNVDNPPGMCQGYELTFPEGKSPHSSYPFALHDVLPLPWSYEVSWDGRMALHAVRCCRMLDTGVESCRACQRLGENSYLDGILTRLEEGTHPNSAFAYHGVSGLIEMLQRKNQQIEFHRHRGLNQARKLLTHVKALDNHKRLLMAIASGKVVRIAQLISIGLRQKKGVLALLESVINAAQGWYSPNGFTEEEDMKGLLFLRLGSNRLAEINHRANGGPSVSYLRRRSTVPPLTPSHAQPTIEQVKKNLEATVESILDVVQNRFQLGSTLHTVLMFDEIATEKRIRWDPKTNHLLGVCREHAHKISTVFVNETDMEELFRSIDNGDVHYAAEATVSAVGALCKDNRIYPARPVLVSGDCKRESGEEHAVVIQTVLDGVNSLKDRTKFRIVSIASDGETRRGSAFIRLTFKGKLDKESSIFSLLEGLTFLNLWVGDDDLTCDKDYKHIFKRFRNLFIRDRGVEVNRRRITPDIILGQFKSVGLSADHVRSLFNPNDKQDVKMAYDMLKDIWNLPRLCVNQNRGFLENREALWILGKFVFHLVFPYLCVDLTLSEQVEHLSAAAHLGLALYDQGGKEFIPTNLYIDVMIMIKNVIFCIAKAIIDNPEGEFWIILLGTDRLEELFGILRTMVGNDSNLDILQLVSRLAGTTEVSNILAKYPHWDRSPRRLRLPALSRDSKEVPDSADHIKPGSWRGNVKVKDISLRTSWKRGRRLVEEECDFVKPILEKLEKLGADILAPSGTLLFDIPLDDDDVDDSLENLSPETQAESALPSDETETIIDMEDNLTEALSEKVPDSTVISHKVAVNGKELSKARALSQYSKHRKFAGSTDRLKRVQAVGRYAKDRSHSVNISGLSEAENVLVVNDPIATLIYSENQFWLGIGEVNGLRIDGQSVGYISLDMLTEETVSISYQMLGLRRASSDDDPELKHDWRTYAMAEKSFTVPGRLVQVMDPTLSKTHKGVPFYLFQGSALVALAASIFQDLTISDLKRVPKLAVTHEYPYRESSGSACFVCENDRDLGDISRQTTCECPCCDPAVILDLSQGQRVLEHMAAHILYDPVVIRSNGPLCGLCLRPPSQCRYFLSKGKGAHGNLRVDPQKSNGCLMKMSWFYHIAAESTVSSPCSNVPVQCPICPKADPAIWKYFMKAHFQARHPTLSVTDYEDIWWLSTFEREEMKKIWAKRTQGTVKQAKKSQMSTLVISEAHRARVPSESSNTTSRGLQESPVPETVSSNELQVAPSEVIDIDSNVGVHSQTVAVDKDEGENEVTVGEREASPENLLEIPCGSDLQTSEDLEAVSTAAPENSQMLETTGESLEPPEIGTATMQASHPLLPPPQVIQEGDVVPSKRKRKTKQTDVLNKCLCGKIVVQSDPENPGVKCKYIGCETQWVSLCIAI